MDEMDEEEMGEEEEEEMEEDEETEEDTTEDTETPRSSVDEGRREEQGIFAHALGCVGRLVERSSGAVWAALTLGDSTPAARTRLADQHDAATAPAVRAPYVVSCALACLLALTTTLRVATAPVLTMKTTTSSTVATDGTDAAAGGDAKADKETETGGAESWGMLVDGVWPALLAGLEAGLERTTDEGVVAALAKAYETLVGVCGALGRDAARDAFLASLVRFVLLPSAMATLPAPLTPAAYATASASSPPAPAVALLAPLVAARNEHDRSTHTHSGSGSGNGNIGTAEAVRRALAAKGLTATRTLFALVHGAGNVLGAGGWRIALGALDGLHRAAALLGLGAALPCDDNARALRALYGCARHLAPGALRALLGALCALSDAELRAARPRTEAAPALLRGAVDPARNTASALVARLATYYARRAALVARLNADRCDVYWAPYAAFLRANIASPSPDVRALLTASYGSILRAVLIREEEGSSGGVSRSSSEATTSKEMTITGTTTTTTKDKTEEKEEEEKEEDEFSDDGEEFSTEAMGTARCDPEFRSSEETLLAMQTTLFEDGLRLLEATADTAAHVRLLADVHRVLQAAGHRLVAAWPHVLAILAAAARLPDRPAVVSHAFQTVLLVSTDYLPCLMRGISEEEDKEDKDDKDTEDGKEEGCMGQYIGVVALYAKQTDHMNISLSSEDVLWSVASYLSKVASGTAATAAQCQELALQVMRVLQELAGDARADVRNSSITTLFRIVTSHPALCAHDVCLWDVLFPMLDSVQARAVACDAETEADSSAAAARTSTEARAWAQSVCLVFEGMGRVLRLAAEADAGTAPRFAEEWARTCAYLEACATQLRTPDVAEAALAALAALAARAAELRLASPAWPQCLAATRAVVAAVVAHAPHSPTAGQALNAFVRAWTAILPPQHIFDVGGETKEEKKEEDGEEQKEEQEEQYLKEEDVCEMCDVVAPLGLLLVEDYTERDGLTALQLAVAAFLARAAGHSAAREAVAGHILRTYAAYAARAAAALPSGDKEALTGVTELRCRALTAFACAMCTALAGAYASRALTTDRVRATAAEPVVARLGEALADRHTALAAAPPLITSLRRTLWLAAARTLTALLPHATATLPTDAGTAEASDAWERILAVTNTFLFGDGDDESIGSGSSTEEQKKEDEQVDVEVVRTVSECYLAHAADAAVDTRFAAHDAAAVALFSHGAHAAATQGRAALCEACYHALFALASVDAARSAALIAVAAPAVLTRARDVLAQYAQCCAPSEDDDGKEKDESVYAACVLETRCVLRECATLRTALPEDAAPTPAHCSPALAPRRHLAALFPLLCGLVAVPQTDVKPELAALLQLAGKTFLAQEDAE